jgi:hypothetical protein
MVMFYLSVTREAEEATMITLSSNHYSVDDQANDVLSWLTDPENAALAGFSWSAFTTEFPEWQHAVWSGAWLDTDAMGVDPEFMSWVIDWIERNSRVTWDDGEPYLLEDSDLAEA